MLGTVRGGDALASRLARRSDGSFWSSAAPRCCLEGLPKLRLELAEAGGEAFAIGVHREERRSTAPQPPGALPSSRAAIPDETRTGSPLEPCSPTNSAFPAASFLGILEPFTPPPYVFRFVVPMSGQIPSHAFLLQRPLESLEHAIE